MTLGFRKFAVSLMIAGFGAVSASAQQVYKPGDGITLPVVETQVRPTYTQEAMNQRITGTVVLECVVRDDGRVGDVTVTKSLDDVYGLDLQAVSALRQWTFKPVTREGKPVAVLVFVEINFELK